MSSDRTLQPAGNEQTVQRQKTRITIAGAAVNNCLFRWQRHAAADSAATKRRHFAHVGAVRQFGSGVPPQ